MKHILLTLALLASFAGSAQIVNIPDANFKNALLNHNPVIDTNGDGEIQVSEAVAVMGVLNVAVSEINDLTGIQSFVNIDDLRCWNNNLSQIDITQNVNLKRLNCSGNSLLNELDVTSNILLEELQFQFTSVSSIDVSQNPILISLRFEHSNVSSLNVSQNPLLEDLICYVNNIESLDVSQNPNLKMLLCYDN